MINVYVYFGSGSGHQSSSRHNSTNANISITQVENGSEKQWQGAPVKTCTATKELFKE